MSYEKVIPVLHIDDRTAQGSIIVQGAKTRFIATIAVMEDEIYIEKSRRDEHGRIPRKYLSRGVADEVLEVHGADKMEKDEIIKECEPYVKEMFPDFCEAIKYGEMLVWSTTK